MRALLSYFCITLKGKTWKISPLLIFEMLGVFVTHWLPMASILFGIVRIWSSLFNCSYHKNKKLFQNFLFHLWNLHQVLSIFGKKIVMIANVFLNLRTGKTWLDHSLKSAVWEHPLAFNMFKGPKHLWNMHEGPFILLFDHCESKWYGKYLPYWTLNS